MHYKQIKVPMEIIEKYHHKQKKKTRSLAKILKNKANAIGNQKTKSETKNSVGKCKMAAYNGSGQNAIALTLTDDATESYRQTNTCIYIYICTYLTKNTHTQFMLIFHVCCCCFYVGFIAVIFAQAFYMLPLLTAEGCAIASEPRMPLALN